MTDEFGAFNPFEEEEKKDSPTDENPFVSEEKKPLKDVSFEETHQKKIEHEDEERLDEIEDEYKELDEDLIDVDEEDTMWLIQRVGIGILKIVGVVGIIGLILWSIWGGSNESEQPKSEQTNQVVEKENTQQKPVVKNSPKEEVSKKEDAEKKTEKVGLWEKIFGSPKKVEIIPKEKENNTEKIIPAVTLQEENLLAQEQKSLTPDTSSIQLMAWNYWMEKERLLGQKSTPGEIALWTKDAEALFDVPFARQVSGSSDIEREKRVNALFKNTEILLTKAENIQNKTLAEISEFEAKQQLYTQEAIVHEQRFLAAMQSSDPSGIDEFLKDKIAAEKKQLENGIEAESRRLLSQKLDNYAQVIINLRNYLRVNRKALVKDVQVVVFPEDPFNRIISIQEWEALGSPSSN